MLPAAQPEQTRFTGRSGPTPTGQHLPEDETGSIGGGTWKMGIQALPLPVTPGGESLSCLKPLRWVRK